MLMVYLKSRIVNIESSLSFLRRVKDIEKFFIRNGTHAGEGEVAIVPARRRSI
jgi:hypothetical protein